MKEENDPMNLIEQFKLKIKEKGLVHQCLLKYLGLSADKSNLNTKEEEKLEDAYRILNEKNITANKSELREYLMTISHLWGIHQTKKELKHKIENLFIILKKDIKNIFSEKEIFHIFHSYKNNFILLVLVEQNILSIKTIVQDINSMEYNDGHIIKFFYPEIRKYNRKYFNDLIIKNQIYGLRKFVEANDHNRECFLEIRKEGEKEPKIIELIKEDKVEEFISFVEHSPINLNKRIHKEETIFETDPIDLTPIEYSALFGSIAIFKYLYMKEVDINIIVGNDNDNIIEYAIQGRNYEIIHLLEERKEIIEELNNQNNQQKLVKRMIKELVKIHYNEIFEYFMTNYDIHASEEITDLIIISLNYQLFDQLIESNQIDFKDNATITNIFNSFCENANDEIVKILKNQPNLDINSKNKILHYSLNIQKMHKKITGASLKYSLLLIKIKNLIRKFDF